MRNSTAAFMAPVRPWVGPGIRLLFWSWRNWPDKAIVVSGYEESTPWPVWQAITVSPPVIPQAPAAPAEIGDVTW